GGPDRGGVGGGEVSGDDLSGAPGAVAREHVVHRAERDEHVDGGGVGGGGAALERSSVAEAGAGEGGAAADLVARGGCGADRGGSGESERRGGRGVGERSLYECDRPGRRRNSVHVWSCVPSHR